MGNLKMCCYIKNMQDERRNWKVNILLTESGVLTETEKLLETARDVIENSNFDERTKRKHQKNLSAYYYNYLMENGYTHEEIFILLKQEFNKYYDRPNSNAIVNALAFELNCLNLAIENKNMYMNLFEYIDNNDLYLTESNHLSKRRSL